jgi:hypothetical protein
MRGAGEPLPIRVIAAAALAAKGIKLPDRRTMRLTRLRLQQLFSTWGKRGLVVSVGSGKRTLRALAD